MDSVAAEMLRPANFSNVLKSVQEIEDHHLSLVILNTHPSINCQMPNIAAVVEAGGIHCRPSRSLPKVMCTSY